MKSIYVLIENKTPTAPTLNELNKITSSRIPQATKYSSATYFQQANKNYLTPCATTLNESNQLSSSRIPQATKCSSAAYFQQINSNLKWIKTSLFKLDN